MPRKDHTKEQGGVTVRLPVACCAAISTFSHLLPGGWNDRTRGAVKSERQNSSARKFSRLECHSSDSCVVGDTLPFVGFQLKMYSCLYKKRGLEVQRHSYLSCRVFT